MPDEQSQAVMVKPEVHNRPAISNREWYEVWGPIWVFLLSCMAIMGGCFCVITAIYPLVEVGGLDLDADFEYFEKGCEIKKYAMWRDWGGCKPNEEGEVNPWVKPDEWVSVADQQIPEGGGRRLVERCDEYCRKVTVSRSVWSYCETTRCSPSAACSVGHTIVWQVCGVFNTRFARAAYPLLQKYNFTTPEHNTQMSSINWYLFPDLKESDCVRAETYENDMREWDAGEVVDCWKGKGNWSGHESVCGDPCLNKDVESMQGTARKYYDCGNERCWKVFSPYERIATIMDIIMFRFYMGVGLLVGGFGAIWVLLKVCTAPVEKKKVREDQPVGVVPGGNAAVVPVGGA